MSENDTAPVRNDLIQIVTCEVLLKHGRHVVPRAPSEMTTVPELAVLHRIHEKDGQPDVIRNVKHAGYVKRFPVAERSRLAARYGRRIVEDLYPGQVPQMQMKWPEDTPPPGERCIVGDFAPVDEGDDEVDADDIKEPQPAKQSKPRRPKRKPVVPPPRPGEVPDMPTHHAEAAAAAKASDIPVVE